MTQKLDLWRHYSIRVEPEAPPCRNHVYFSIFDQNNLEFCPARYFAEGVMCDSFASNATVKKKYRPMYRFINACAKEGITVFTTGNRKFMETLQEKGLVTPDYGRKVHLISVKALPVLLRKFALSKGDGVGELFSNFLHNHKSNLLFTDVDDMAFTRDEELELNKPMADEDFAPITDLESDSMLCNEKLDEWKEESAISHPYCFSHLPDDADKFCGWTSDLDSDTTCSSDIIPTKQLNFSFSDSDEEDTFINELLI